MVVHPLQQRQCKDNLIMTTRDFTANVISATKVVPDGNFKDSKASGVWDINEALDLIKGGNWPNAANLNPATFVDGLFQCHVHTGDGTNSRAIVNNINFSGSGGLFWIKCRTVAESHNLFDTERGATKVILSDATDANDTVGTTVFESFNNNGVTIGSHGRTNESSRDYVSWSFRKQPKFFDIVTYSGTGSAQAISHNLGSTPGAIFVKQTNEARDWAVFHRRFNGGGSPQNFWMKLNDNGTLLDDATVWNDTAPTSTQFTVGTGDYTNKNGGSYVAYIFAHNDSDGGFGEPGDQDIIKCGNYTGNGSSTYGVFQDLGFEPQWLFVTNTDLSSEPWVMLDSMRGVGGDGSNDPRLQANSSTTEANGAIMKFDATGFTPISADDKINGSSHDYIYIAIRRGGMQTPTAASDVFAVDSLGSTGDGAKPAFRSPFVADMGMRVDISEAYTEIGARLTRQHWLYTNLNNAEASANNSEWDYMNGWYSSTSTASNYHGLMWARARGYFDVVLYNPSSTSNQTITHNLGVKPEMVWIKQREAISSTNREWAVGMPDILGIDNNTLSLNNNYANGTLNYNMFTQQPTATQFVLHGNENGISSNGGKYIAYLFATVAGVSKVGSFTQSGATNVDCGFTGSTPALIILKRKDSTGDWYIFDSLRGIIAGNDPYKVLNEQTAGVTNADIVDPYSSGFATTSTLTNGDYIFYAVAATS